MSDDRLLDPKGESTKNTLTPEESAELARNREQEAAPAKREDKTVRKVPKNVVEK